MILATGATGFVGSRLREGVIDAGSDVRHPLLRMSEWDGVVIGDYGPATDWSEALSGVSCVIHLAARVHLMRDDVDELLVEYRRVNVAGTLKLT